MQQPTEFTGAGEYSDISSLNARAMLRTCIGAARCIPEMMTKKMRLRGQRGGKEVLDVEYENVTLETCEDCTVERILANEDYSRRAVFADVKLVRHSTTPTGYEHPIEEIDTEFVKKGYEKILEEAFEKDDQNIDEAINNCIRIERIGSPGDIEQPKYKLHLDNFFTWSTSVRQEIISAVDRDNLTLKMPADAIVRTQKRLLIGYLPWPIDEVTKPEDIELLGTFLSGGTRALFTPFVMQQARNRAIVKLKEVDLSISTTQSVDSNSVTTFMSFKTLYVSLKRYNGGLYTARAKFKLAGFSRDADDPNARGLDDVEVSTLVIVFGGNERMFGEQLKYCLDKLVPGACDASEVKLILSCIWQHDDSVLDKQSALEFLKHISNPAEDAENVAGELESEQVVTQWETQVHRNILPHLPTVAEKQQFLLTTLARTILILCGLQESDNGSELSNQYVRSPGEKMIFVAKEAYNAMKQGLKNQLDKHTGKKALESRPLQTLLGLPSKAFDKIGMQFLNQKRVKTNEYLAQDLSKELSRLGRMACPMQIEMKSDILNMSTENSLLEKKSLNSSYAGYIDPVHVNATGDRERGGRVMHLATLSAISPPITNAEQVAMVTNLRKELSELSKELSELSNDALGGFKIEDTSKQGVAHDIVVCVNGCGKWGLQLKVESTETEISNLLEKLLERLETVRTNMSDLGALGKVLVDTSASVYSNDHEMECMWGQWTQNKMLRVVDIDTTVGRYIRPLFKFKNKEVCLDSLKDVETARKDNQLSMVSPRELMDMKTLPLRAQVTLSDERNTTDIREGTLIELPPAYSVGILAAFCPALTTVKGNKATLWVKHIEHQLDPAITSLPIVTTTLAFENETIYSDNRDDGTRIRFKGTPSGTVAMMAVIAVGPDTGTCNEEDAIVLSQDAVDRGLLELIRELMVQVKLPTKDLTVGSYAQFCHPLYCKTTHMRDAYCLYIIKEHFLPKPPHQIPSALPMVGKKMNIKTTGCQYVLGLISSSKCAEDAEDVDKSIDLNTLVEMLRENMSSVERGQSMIAESLQINSLRCVYRSNENAPNNAPNQPARDWMAVGGPVPKYDNFAKMLQQPIERILTANFNGFTHEYSFDGVDEQTMHQVKIELSCTFWDNNYNVISNGTISIPIRSNEKVMVPTDLQLVKRHVKLRKRDPICALDNKSIMHALDDKTGLPVVGKKIVNGDYLVGMMIHTTEKRAASQVMDRSTIFAPAGCGKRLEWTIESVKRSGEVVTVKLVSAPLPMRDGCKVASRQGQKGAVMIADSSRMPFFPDLDGIVPDIALHPCAITGRGTPLLLLEQLIATMCSKEGTFAMMDAAACSITTIDAKTNKKKNMNISDVFEKYTSKTTVRSGVTGKIISKEGFCGPVQIHRLKQSGMFTALDNLKVSTWGNIDPYWLQPMQGREDGSLRLGTNETEHIMSLGSTASLMRDYRSVDEIEIVVCPTCDQLLDQNNLCAGCNSDLAAVLRVMSNPMLIMQQTLAASHMKQTQGGKKRKRSIPIQNNIITESMAHPNVGYAGECERMRLQAFEFLDGM